MSYIVEVIKDLCISSGRCVANLPTVFMFDDEQLAIVIVGESEPNETLLLRVARECPGEAIILRDGFGTPIELDR
jgi:ferredoxin